MGIALIKAMNLSWRPFKKSNVFGDIAIIYSLPILIAISSFQAQAVYCSQIFYKTSTEMQTDRVFDQVQKAREALQTQSDFLDFNVLEQGTPIRVKGESYQVVRRLGDGSEADVYLVQNSEGELFVIKKFIGPTLYRANLKAMKKLRRSIGNENLIRIHEVDAKQNLYLQEYLRGEELGELLSHRELPLATKLRLELQLDELNQKLLRKNLKIFSTDLNILALRGSLKLVIIDPY